MGNMCCADLHDDDDDSVCGQHPMMNEQMMGGQCRQPGMGGLQAMLLATSAQTRGFQSHLINNYAQQPMVHQSMMQQQQSNLLMPDEAEELERAAKMRGDTVVVQNGCLYINYKFQGQLAKPQQIIYAR